MTFICSLQHLLKLDSTHSEDGYVSLKTFSFLSDFPAVGDEETEEARAAAELYTTVLQHTGRYKHFIISPSVSFNNSSCTAQHVNLFVFLFFFVILCRD